MTGLCLPQMDHLMVLHRCRQPVACRTGIEAVSLLLRWRQDVAEEGQSLIALAHPEGVDHCRHISSTAGAHGPPHHGNDLEYHQHNGGKGTKKTGKQKRTWEFFHQKYAKKFAYLGIYA